MNNILLFIFLVNDYN